MHHIIKLEYGDSITIHTPEMKPTKVEIVRKSIEDDEHSMYSIFKRICDAFEITIEQILGNNRRRHLVLARLVIASDLITNHNLQITAVGRLLNRHHTTAMYYRTSMKDLLKNNDAHLLKFLKQLERYEKD